MEYRLFHRSKDFRFIRPHRVAFLEWLRALRHNLFCEITLLIDRVQHKNKWPSFRRAFPAFQFSLPELFPEAKTTWGWRTRIRETLSGRRAAEAVRRGWTLFRTQGMKQSWWPFLFLLGIMVGFGLKWWAEDHLTIGFEDYRLSSPTELYDLNALSQAVDAKQGTVIENEKKVYPACNLE